ncbi:erythromycin esterase family protein [Chitinispirillales bacterium ANBcel5]|uniref:erythromycin esterase family protein n=1 Tax=Cellulosispirillum alkaliphilum TaxID=3039283 RepID=UPI002A4E725F|nr:erythromycin esterase family protein [Chitinispirillales bacterium ANBcel5]
MDEKELIAQIEANAFMFTGCRQDLDPLIDSVGEREIVLIGGSTHGTHEFYKTRAQITARLIEEKGFNAVAIEADWPDAYRVNNYVRGIGEDSVSIEALSDFDRFPQWIWRNADILNFVGFLKDFNHDLPSEKKVGFYGLDLYNMYKSIDAVISYLEKIDIDAAALARKRYECFERFGRLEDSYASAMSFIGESCKEKAVAQLQDLRNRRIQYVNRDGFSAREEQFYAEQNARLAKSAEEYYRAMFDEKVISWNIRDRHMADTLEQLREHLRRFNEGKIVVWAHNSHIGDARATQLGGFGELSMGQLLRERQKDKVISIGMHTYRGTVSASAGWGGSVGRKNLKQALGSSLESIFHQTGINSFFLDPSLISNELYTTDIYERVIGAVYTPETENEYCYIKVRLPQRYDLQIFYDHTHATEPLEPGWLGKIGDIPHTYGSGL